MNRRSTGTLALGLLTLLGAPSCPAQDAPAPNPPRAAEDRSRPRGRRRARHGAHRRHPHARGAAHPDRLRRRHEHGLDHRRPLLLRLQPRRDGEGDQGDQLGHALRGRAGARPAVLPPEGGRLRPPDPARVRLEPQEGRSRSAAGPRRGQQARLRASERDAPVLHRRQLRRLSHSVPRGGDGHPDRPALRDVEGQPGDGHAGEHGDPGDLHAGRDRRPRADRRRRVREPSRADRQGHGRRHRDRGQRRLLRRGDRRGSRPTSAA